jgi:proline racemase
MKSLEYHVGGQPIRVIVEGVPSPQGKTQSQKAASFARHADRYRRGLVLAPRGHADMSAVLLTEPSTAHAHAGLIFLDAGGYPRLSVAGVMAAARAASEHGLIFARADDNPVRALVFDTPAGTVTARWRADEPAARVVSVETVPSFVYSAGASVALPGRLVPFDIAYSGEFYALVDSEAAGVVLEGSRLDELRRAGRLVCEAVNRSVTVAHADDAGAASVVGVVFTGPARDELAHLRTVLVSAEGAVDVSPGATAAPAVMAVLDAIGLFADADEFTHEGLSGTLAKNRRREFKVVGDRQALVVDVHGEVWATGEQMWILDHEDPFHQGLRPPVAGN